MAAVAQLFHKIPYALHAAACCFLICYGLLVSSLGAMSVQSADLYATWVAGEFLAMERPDQVYPAVTGLFDMTTPSEWWAHVSVNDELARIFPYIYPPIWVFLVAPLTEQITFHTFDMIFLAIHQAALIAAVILATRMCGLTGKPRFAVVGLTYWALSVTLPLGLGLAENQPQILVSFLIVFAFERAHFGRLRTAGALLALAAAIKLYPLLFVVIFAGRRQWPAVASFALVGAALGLTSIALAGWPLHAHYLDLIKSLTRSVILSNFSLSIDAYLAATVFPDRLTGVALPRDINGAPSWAALSKTPLWVTASAMANLVALGAMAWVAAKRSHDPLVLPLAATVFALLSPLSWAYTYMTAFVFLGALPLRLGLMGYALTALATVFFHRAVPRGVFGKLDVGVSGGWVVAIGFMIVFAVAFALALTRSAATNPPTSP